MLGLEGPSPGLRSEQDSALCQQAVAVGSALFLIYFAGREFFGTY